MSVVGSVVVVSEGTVGVSVVGVSVVGVSVVGVSVVGVSVVGVPVVGVPVVGVVEGDDGRVLEEPVLPGVHVRVWSGWVRSDVGLSDRDVELRPPDPLWATLVPSGRETGKAGAPVDRGEFGSRRPRW